LIRAAQAQSARPHFGSQRPRDRHVVRLQP
jgi:hypothetical protein